MKRMNQYWRTGLWFPGIVVVLLLCTGGNCAPTPGQEPGVTDEAKTEGVVTDSGEVQEQKTESTPERSAPPEPSQPDPRPEPRPEPQPEPKPEPALPDQSMPEPGPEPIPEPRPEPQPEPRPEPKPEPTPEKTSECVNRQGYCTNTTCKSGYTALNNPLGCAATCCLPTPSCGKEGDTISLTEQCCAGLTKGSTGRPPGCVTTGQKFVCVKCGDGNCDASKGENECSCPSDCKSNPGNACTQQGGTCQNSRLPCKPGTKQDASLSCGSLVLACCVPTTGSGCKSLCDCTQGLLCASGQCIAGIVPAYCCNNPGCPTGKACTTNTGQSSVCP